MAVSASTIVYLDRDLYAGAAFGHIATSIKKLSNLEEKMCIFKEKETMKIRILCKTMLLMKEANLEI